MKTYKFSTCVNFQDLKNILAWTLINGLQASLDFLFSLAAIHRLSKILEQEFERL